MVTFLFVADDGLCVVVIATAFLPGSWWLAALGHVVVLASCLCSGAQPGLGFLSIALYRTDDLVSVSIWCSMGLTSSFIFSALVGKGLRIHCCLLNIRLSGLLRAVWLEGEEFVPSSPCGSGVRNHG